MVEMERGIMSVHADSLAQLLYTFKDRDEVMRFLERDMAISSCDVFLLLHEIRERLAWYFRLCVVCLEVTVDPGDGSKTLVISVQIGPDRNAEEAGAAMEKFDDEWWLDNLHRGLNKIVVTLEFTD